MSSSPVPDKAPWRRSRYGFAAFFLLSLLASCFILRLVILVQFRLPTSKITSATVAKIFLVGLHQDLVVALITSLPLLFWLWVIRDSTFGAKWFRNLFMAGFFLFWAVRVFLFFAEYYFFEEFQSRFTTVAVDYLLYPHEVFVNIWDSYPVPLVVFVCSALSLIWVVGAFWYFRPMWQQPAAAKSRLLYFAGGCVLVILLIPTVSLQGTHFSSDRTLNEVANNGSISFVDAAWTHDLDYSAFYKTLPRDVAYDRVHELLSARRATFIGDRYSIRRKIAGDPSRPKLNVVILLEESLGSEFWGTLGRKGPSLTPRMDQLATNEALFFTNIYACGNRTVRGFEGVLSSFPPEPGDSIVKRDRSENVESVARVLKRDGYSTVFFYGGRGLFDNMKSYALNNGWDRFIEQKDFPHPTFSTVWGVCDEDVYARAIEEFRKLSQAGKPFLGTIMSVSNHKPYTYPRGRIPEDPEKPKPTRAKAVKYSDWCLGKFFADAKKEAFWTNTVFVVVADHGARVYGSQDIPIFSYEIPLVILGPAAVKQPERIGTLGNSLDVSPTLLGLIGRPYQSMFFGRDLLRDSPEKARALLNHNRDIGMFRDNRMVVLGLQKTVEFYKGNPKVTNLKLVKDPSPEFFELETNATAIYQVADELYMHRLYRIDGMPSAQELEHKTNRPPQNVAQQTSPN